MFAFFEKYKGFYYLKKGYKGGYLETIDDYMVSTAWVDNLIHYCGGLYFMVTENRLLIGFSRVNIPFFSKKSYSYISIPKKNILLTKEKRSLSCPSDFYIQTNRRDVYFGIDDSEVRDLICKWI